MSIRIRQSPILTVPDFLFWYNVVYIKVKPFFKKIVFSHWYKKYGWQKCSQNLKPWKYWNFRRQYLLVSSRSHAFVMVSMFEVWKCNKKIKKHVISLAPLQVMPQNHKKCNFLAISYWNTHCCPKDHMAESKYSEKPPLVLTNLIQIVMWPISHQEI